MPAVVGIGVSALFAGAVAFVFALLVLLWMTARYVLTGDV